jgi:ferric-dicitrate binding protein FerR (iron transport regulator)
MAKKTKKAAPYLQRLAEDEYVQEQLRNAARRLREAYDRTRRERGRAAEDKKVYDNVREAAISIRRAGARLRRKPEPKRRGRKLALVAVAGGTAVLISRSRKAKPASSGNPPIMAPEAVGTSTAN